MALCQLTEALSPRTNLDFLLSDASTTPADSMATSVPAPMAMPTSARASMAFSNSVGITRSSSGSVALKNERKNPNAYSAAARSPPLSSPRRSTPRRKLP